MCSDRIKLGALEEEVIRRFNCVVACTQGGWGAFHFEEVAAEPAVTSQQLGNLIFGHQMICVTPVSDKQRALSVEEILTGMKYIFLSKNLLVALSYSVLFLVGCVSGYFLSIVLRSMKTADDLLTPELTNNGNF